MLTRVVFNVVLFAVLLGGIGFFFLHRSAGRSDLGVVDVVVVTALGALWAGALIALIETRVYPIANTAKRLALAAVAGAAAYAGLFSGIAFLAARSQGSSADSFFLLLGCAIGSVSHAVRARIYGGDAIAPESE